ncbi:hypothetical protein LTR24_000896 [Lithohypha guttulata]|uniref:Uncharacterized protein n=1 Tax=Lithohypha guttulata TaxID=1690604 RepID=A0ABR0KME0_9EURO|nr:hypothetical protein LTR24_000896 [Lithohypha guttulata]
MKLLTTNFLTCAIKTCKTSSASYPLHFRDAQLEQNPSTFNPTFVKNILPRLDWTALSTTAAELGLSAMLPDHNPADDMMVDSEGATEAEIEAAKDKQVDEETLKKLHTLLMETGVVEGKLVCGNCGFEYPIKEGVGNFLLPPHLPPPENLRYDAIQSQHMPTHRLLLLVDPKTSSRTNLEMKRQPSITMLIAVVLFLLALIISRLRYLIAQGPPRPSSAIDDIHKTQSSDLKPPIQSRTLPLPPEDAPPPSPGGVTWKVTEYFAFYQFDAQSAPDTAATFKNMVQSCILEIHKILSKTIDTLSVDQRNPSVGNPSFNRYFRPQDTNTVMGVFKSILIVTGCPVYAPALACSSFKDVRRLWTFYGDPPVSIFPQQSTPGVVTCANSPTQSAYYHWWQDPADQTIYGFIAICPWWFRWYRNAEGSYALDRRLNPFGKSIAISGKRNLYWEPTGSSTQALLHELIHHGPAYINLNPPVQPRQIEDVTLVRPDGTTEIAYGSFRSMRVKDWQTRPARNPTDNVDNYVFTAMEIYYRDLYDLGAWMDSPDPRGAGDGPPIVWPWGETWFW